MRPIRNKRCVIIGPSGSGKTTLLGTLQFATSQARQPDMALRMLPVSPDISALIGRSNAAVLKGEYPSTATQKVNRYVFDYEIIHNRVGGTFRKTSRTRFSMTDTPGAALLGDRTKLAEHPEMKEARAEAVEELSVADYIIICADSTDEELATDFIQYLPEALAETRADRLACSRLVICLTKADRYAARHPGIRTLDQFRYEDPIACALRIISTESLRLLNSYLLDNVEIRVGWASAAGFDPHTGLPNYNADREGVLVDPAGGTAAIRERWRPYRIIDPFVFLTMGDAMGLKRMASPESNVPGVPRPEFFNRFTRSSDRLESAWQRIKRWFRILVEFVR